MVDLYNTVIQATIYGSIVGIIIFVLKTTILKNSLQGGSICCYF